MQAEVYLNPFFAPHLSSKCAKIFKFLLETLKPEKYFLHLPAREKIQTMWSEKFL
jgi:hypothetical protein